MSPRCSTSTVTTSPLGAVSVTAARPRSTRCTAPAGSPSWNTTSPRANRRRRQLERRADSARPATTVSSVQGGTTGKGTSPSQHPWTLFRVGEAPSDRPASPNRPLVAHHRSPDARSPQSRSTASCRHRHRPVRHRSVTARNQCRCSWTTTGAEDLAHSASCTSARRGGTLMNRFTLSTVIVAASISVGAVAAGPSLGGAAAATVAARPSSGGLCTRIVGTHNHFAVVVYPCSRVARWRDPSRWSDDAAARSHRDRRRHRRGVGVRHVRRQRQRRVLPPAMAAPSADHVVGSWLIEREDERTPSPTRGVFSFTDGGVVIHHDIAPVDAGVATGAWRGASDGSVVARFWEGVAADPSQGTPATTAGSPPPFPSTEHDLGRLHRRHSRCGRRNPRGRARAGRSRGLESCPEQRMATCRLATDGGGVQAGPRIAFRLSRPSTECPAAGHSVLRMLSCSDEPPPTRSGRAPWPP